MDVGVRHVWSLSRLLVPALVLPYYIHIYTAFQ
jgi:hypothetical protein